MPFAHDAGVRAAIAASDSNPYGGGGTDREHHKHHQERTEKGPTRVAGSGWPEVNGDTGMNHTAAAPLIAPYTHLKRLATSQRVLVQRKAAPASPQPLDLAQEFGDAVPPHLGGQNRRETWRVSSWCRRSRQQR